MVLKVGKQHKNGDAWMLAREEALRVTSFTFNVAFWCSADRESLLKEAWKHNKNYKPN